MPIYAYKCSDCGFAKDVLRKLSDPPLSTCPSCGAGTFTKQVTAAGFQLKGSGWYVTDFRDGGGKKPTEKKADGEAAAATAVDGGNAKPAEGGAPASTSAPAATPGAPAPSTSSKGAPGPTNPSASTGSGGASASTGAGGSTAKGD